MLFFWTFYIVIKNINATNAAIEAKYESEHDKLTGLYNKGKYINMKEENFGNPSSIAIYNFDVNNLKHINDTFGHELEDELIIKVAKSIHAVVSDKVYGFRMGGDEYVMIGLNITSNEAQEVYKNWENALSDLNKEGQMYCVMACGLKYAEGDFNYDETELTLTFPVYNFFPEKPHSLSLPGNNNRLIKPCFLREFPVHLTAAII